MGEFEDRLRDAFDGELARTPAPPNLRQRVILNAVSTPRPGTRRFGAPAPGRVFAFGGALAAVAAIAVVAGSVGIALGRNGGTVAQESPAPSASPAPVAFGKLPPPNFNPPQGLGSGGGRGTDGRSLLRSGADELGGTAAPGSRERPVIQLPHAGSAEADAFAARLGAKLDARGTGTQNRQLHRPGRFPDGDPAGCAGTQLRHAPGPALEGPRRAHRGRGAYRGKRLPQPQRADAGLAVRDPDQQRRAAPAGRPLRRHRLCSPASPSPTSASSRSGNGGFAPEVDINGDPAGIAADRRSQRPGLPRIRSAARHRAEGKLSAPAGRGRDDQGRTCLAAPCCSNSLDRSQRWR